MTLQERWEAFGSLMLQQQGYLTEVIGRIKRQLSQHRKELRSAEVRASAKVYENKSIIGGMRAKERT